MPALPWETDAATFAEAVAEALGATSLVLALLEVDSPQPDAFLACRGVEADRLLAWCNEGYEGDPVLQRARDVGCARPQLGEADASAGPPLPAGEQVMVLIRPAACVPLRHWYFALSRAGQPFETDDLMRASLTLRMIQTAFDSVSAPLAGRLVVGHDDRLIHADPRSEHYFRRAGGEKWTELAATLQPMICQRWPELGDGAPHDLVVEVDGQPVWVRFRRTRAMATLPLAHWHLELRPLSGDDLPPLGIIDDERVARAVGYLTDQYQDGPSLQEIAERVGISPFHFHRLFVRHTGLSPKHYLLRMQLMVAKWLLRATRTPVGETAAATGFASHGHFTATFQRMVGQSPSAYRENVDSQA
ncbi:MAG: helix-turn-helix transcriptional regulator [Phycisphaeraceae bacterium]